MQQIPNVSQADPRSGMWFVFDVPEGRIACWRSAATSRSVIYVNGERVARTWMLGVRSSRTVALGSRTYELVLWVSLRRGSHECVLMHGGRILQGCCMQYVPPARQKTLQALLAGGWLISYAALASGYTAMPGFLLFAALAAGVGAYGSSGGHFVVKPVLQAGVAGA